MSKELSLHLTIVSNLSNTATSVMLRSLGHTSEEKSMVLDSSVVISFVMSVACQLIGANFMAKCIIISFAEYNFVCKKLNLSRRLVTCVESGSC